MIPYRIAKRIPDKFVWGLRRFLPTLPVALELPDRLCWVAHPTGLDIDVVKIEEAERRFVSRTLKPGMIALDIGAHHGLYTLLMSRLVGPSGRVIAFEPSPRERNGLTRHLRLNDCRNVTVEPFAIGSAAGTEGFFVVSGTWTGAGSLREPQLDGRKFTTQKITVPVTSLDGYLKQNPLPRLDFIKMDIEGAELDAFRGARVLLSARQPPSLMVEMGDMVTAPWGYRSKEKYDFLAGMGFEWYSITADGGLVRAVREESYDEITNLVAVPATRSVGLRSA